MTDPALDSRPASGFDLNKPTIIWLLMLASVVTGWLTGIVGLVLAYVWAGEAHDGWEESHFRYAVRTFWIGAVLTVLGVIGTIITLGIGSFIIWPLLLVWLLVRTVKALLAAQRREPVLNVESWLW